MTMAESRAIAKRRTRERSDAAVQLRTIRFIHVPDGMREFASAS